MPALGDKNAPRTFRSRSRCAVPCMHSLAAMPCRIARKADHTICKKELAQKGYAVAKVDHPEVMKSKFGYSYTGQFSIGGQRHEFNCLLGGSFEPQDLAVNPLHR